MSYYTPEPGDTDADRLEADAFRQWRYQNRVLRRPSN